MSEGPASTAQLHELHRLLASAMVKALREPEPSAELLKVTGRFMADNAATVLLDDADVGTLKRLRKLYLVKLQEAMEAPDEAPNASLLGEVRRALTVYDPDNEAGERIEVAKTVHKLASAGLPFA